MAIGTNNTVLDDFSGTLGGWTNSEFGNGDAAIVAGAFTSSTAASWGSAKWSTVYPPDMEASAQITTLPDSGDRISLWARNKFSGGGDATGYVLNFDAVGGAWDLLAYDNNNQVNIVSGTQVFSTNDWFGIQAIGNVITAWRKPSAGAWAQLGSSMTDSSVSGSGNLCLEVFNTVGMVDSFSGGSVSVANVSWFQG